jgi:hypothetical protein
MHFLNEVSKKIGAMEVSNKSYSIMVSAAEASGVAKETANKLVSFSINSLVLD